MRKIIIFIIRAYQYLISPYLAPSCRYSPTCSEYAIEAFQRFGFIRGLVLSVRRIFSCHPWCCGGHDPVPDVFSFKDIINNNSFKNSATNKNAIKKNSQHSIQCDKRIISGNHK